MYLNPPFAEGGAFHRAITPVWGCATAQNFRCLLEIVLNVPVVINSWIIFFFSVFFVLNDG